MRDTVALRSAWAIPAVVLVALAFAIRVSVGPLPIDDAFITFRYARNIAEGLGFVYDEGQHVLGTTTPLWTLVLALGHLLGLHDLPRLALGLSAVCDSLSTALLFVLARRLGWRGPWPAILAALYALSPPSIAFATSGMETSLFVLLILGAASMAAADRPARAGLLAGLATLARPEGMLVGFLVIASTALNQRSGSGQRWRRTGYAVAAFVATVAPWVLFATWWFGSPLPQSAIAKAVAYRERASPFLATLSLASFLGHPGWHPLGPPLYVLGRRVSSPMIGLACALPWLVMVPTIIRMTRARPIFLPILWFGPLLMLGYAIGGLRGVVLCPWYTVPLVPFVLLGALALARQMARQGPPLLAACLVALVVVWTLLGLSFGAGGAGNPLRPRGINLAKEEALLTAARYLEPGLSPGTVVALPEIGVFGYTSHARILDGAGLVSPEAMRYFPIPRGEETFPPALLQREQPDYLVAVDWYFTDKLIHAPWFRHDYSLKARIPCALTAPEPHAVLVYARGPGIPS